MSKNSQQLQLLLTIAGAFVLLLGVTAILFRYLLVGSFATLIGGLVLLAGAVVLVAANHAKRKLPKTVEEQRQIIRSMADDIRARRSAAAEPERRARGGRGSDSR